MGLMVIFPKLVSAGRPSPGLVAEVIVWTIRCPPSRIHERIAFRDPGTGEVIGVAISYPTSMATSELQDRITGLLKTMKTNLMRHK